MKRFQTVQTIFSKLRKLSFPNTFNPYVDCCTQYDKPYAPEIRAKLIYDILIAAADEEIDSIWIGRDLGYRGGRRTGLAFTDDFHFSAHTKRWGIETERPTFGSIVRERTATVIWETLATIKERVFLWNVFPLHPYTSGDSFNNRKHNTDEREAGVNLLLLLIPLLQPRRLVAIGNDSSRVLNRMFTDIEICDVRHPSHGGDNLFREQTNALYES